MTRERNIKLLLAFDGTGYAGWQKQKSDRTIQGVLEKKLGVMTGENVTVHGAGRTDAGVHALGMVANFHTGSDIPSQGFAKGLNSMLAHDIRILDGVDTGADFHARRSAVGKIYWYDFCNAPVQLPTKRFYETHIQGDLDFEAMGRGLALLAGTHDFTSFEGTGSRDVDAPGRGAVRTISRISLEKRDGETGYRFIIAGDGFLRHMVRNIAGTIFEVGRSRLAHTDVASILAARDRSAAGPTAPACGLFLKEVLYP